MVNKTSPEKTKIVIKQSSSKTQKKSSKKSYKILLILLKVIIITSVLFGFYYTSQTFSNSISLLAVSEDDSGNIHGGSIIKLNLKVRPGTGQTYVNLNTIEEVDTQISIINSQKIACNLFKLDCDNYDFYYDFEGSALVLKGPSASSAIAILTAKTLEKEKLDDKTVITGALNSGGVMGNVGGVDQKIDAAQREGFHRVVIPVFSDYNETKERNVEVLKAIDIVEAHNYFNGKKFIPEEYKIDNTEYSSLMKHLGELMCNRSLELKSMVDFDSIKENSSLSQFRDQADKSFNLSLEAYENGNYYSMGSFCYNSNLNYRVLVERQKNMSLENRDEEIKKLSNDLDYKYIELNSKDYRSKIETINDFYVYLVINDRLEEARDFVSDANKLGINIDVINISKDNISDENVTSNNVNITVETNDLNESLVVNDDSVRMQKENLYSYALERLYTVGLWETFISNSGAKITFDDSKINEACLKIYREVNIKSELLKKYGLSFFDDDVSKLSSYTNPLANNYLCIYKGLELNGRISTVLNAVGIKEENQKEYTQKILDIAASRLVSNSNGNFPLIPYIYLEYSQDLFKQEDYASAMLYSNFALSYGDLDLYLEKEKIDRSYFNAVMNELFNSSYLSLFFVGLILVVLGFIS